MIEIARIPEDRITSVIGKGGSVKKRIERTTGTRIDVTDIVKIEGEDPIMVLKARDVVLAIGRGFSSKVARRIVDEDCGLHVISLRGESDKTRKRLLGRVIGNEGRAKKMIERETGADISIKGKTLSVIGSPDQLGPAEEALGDLLSGRTHACAYSSMRRKKARSDS